jgi:three-Cys-motif partner protein
MTEKPYDFIGGAPLEPHTARKHKILREYMARYLTVRCQDPRRERFRLAIVEGFAGGGRYKDGSPGSPVIFVEELKTFVTEANIRRAAEGMRPLEVECLLVLNDVNKDVVELLRTNLAPLLADVTETTPALYLKANYHSEPFEQAYPKFKEVLRQGGYQNVLFTLDQCGHSHIQRRTLHDILRTYHNGEIFYTFMIGSLLAYLQSSDAEALAAQLTHLELGQADLQHLEAGVTKREWLGIAERIVFDAFSACGPFHSPFSINNPNGWRYWFIHFSNSYRGRQVYNKLLHDNSSAQAHFGRSECLPIIKHMKTDRCISLMTPAGLRPRNNSWRISRASLPNSGMRLR